MRPLPATSAKKKRSFQVGFRVVGLTLVCFFRLRVGSTHEIRTYGSELPQLSLAARLLALMTTSSTSPRSSSASSADSIVNGFSEI